MTAGIETARRSARRRDGVGTTVCASDHRPGTVRRACGRQRTLPGFVWESARNRVDDDLWELLEGLVESGTYHPGPVAFRRPLVIDPRGAAYLYRTLPIDQLLPLEPPTEDAVARAGDEISRGVGSLPVVVLLEAEGAGTVVEKGEYFEATRRQGFDIVRCWVRLGRRLDVELSGCPANRGHASVQESVGTAD